MPYAEISAFTGMGLNEAMDTIRDLVLSSIDGKRLQRPSNGLQRPKTISFSSPASRDADAATFEEWKQTRESSCCS